MSAPERRVGKHAQPGLGRVAMVDQGHAAAAGQPGPCARGAYLGCPDEQRRRENGGADRRVRHSGRKGELVDAVVGTLVDPTGGPRGVQYRQAGDLLDRGDSGGDVDGDPLQDALSPD